MGDEALLLVPGLMCDHTVWEPVMPALEARLRCTVVALADVDDLARMAHALLADAPARFALAGHSMGARVALEVLRQAPQRVSRIALLDTGYLARAPGAAGEEEARKRQSLLDLARAQGVRAMATEWVQGMVHPQRIADDVLIGRIVAMFERKSADTFARQIRALLGRPDASAVLGAIAVPALVLCGRQDSWAPVPQHQQIHQRIAQATLAVVEEAGHMAPMERPDAVSAHLLRWLDQD
ncbi:MAG: alpha/beta hydrolase [Rhodoferax sp.]|jgi:pimeloyl-ACP methyl ester carboxylesterase|nr:alpha/beta hydrolase [Rhodoferax sp.]